MSLLKTISMVLLFTYSTYAQIELRGTVKDSSNVAIEFANVVLTNQKNEIVKGTITNEYGIFSITVKEGRYKLSISFLGYKDWLKEISIDDGYDFGVVILEESKNNLDEVVIKGEKRIIEKKVDRLIFNVSKSISIDGGNAIDALKYTPLLQVNDGELSLIGKSGLGVMVDNRIIKLSGDDLTDFLQSLPSENIDRIEVITNPLKDRPRHFGKPAAVGQGRKLGFGLRFGQVGLDRLLASLSFHGDRIEVVEAAHHFLRRCSSSLGKISTKLQGRWR